MEQLLQDIDQNLLNYYEDLVVLLPKIIIGLIIFILFRFVANRTKKLSLRQLSKALDDQLLVNFLAKSIKASLTIIGLLIALKIIGLGSIVSSILAGAGISAFIIGFAFKDIGENLLAGVMMAFNRPFNVGDVIEVNGNIGKVLNLTLRKVQIKTFDGKDVYIPNANIIKNTVINYTIDGFIRMDYNIQLNSNQDIQKAIDLILNILHQTEHILNDTKKPTVFVSNYEHNVVTLTIHFWLETDNPAVGGLSIKTQVILKSIEELKANNIILANHQILEVKNHPNETLLVEQKGKV